MKRHWNNLQTRDRRILIGGAAALLLLFAYAGVWEPLTTRTDALRDNVRVERETLHWMHQAASEVRSLRGQATTAGSTEPLLTRVDAAARKHGLAEALKRVQPEAGETVRVWLEGASFDGMLRWLHELGSGGVRVSSLVVDRTDTAGQVNARISLLGGGG